MKKSHAIQLTVVAAMGMAAHAQQAPPPAAPTQNCKQARKAAKKNGTPVPPSCVQTGGHAGGFGSTAHAHSHGSGG
jgi:hypothetical protein